VPDSGLFAGEAESPLAQRLIEFWQTTVYLN